MARLRADVSPRLPSDRRAALGQHLTPAALARFLAGMPMPAGSYVLVKRFSRRGRKSWHGSSPRL